MRTDKYLLSITKIKFKIDTSKKAFQFSAFHVCRSILCLYRLDRREFELDVEEQNRRVEEGRYRAADLETELRAWNLARAQVALRVKDQVWRSMETPGRALCGLRLPRVVHNFPLPRLTPHQEARLITTIQVYF